MGAARVFPSLTGRFPAAEKQHVPAVGRTFQKTEEALRQPGDADQAEELAPAAPRQLGALETMEASVPLPWFTLGRPQAEASRA